MATASRAWTRCAGCQRCEYNDVLRRSDNMCAHCGEKVVPYQPKRSASRDKGKKKVSFVNDGSGNLLQPKGILRSASPSTGSKGNMRGMAAVTEHLQLALQASDDAQLKDSLQKQIQQLEKDAAGDEGTVTPVEALRRADSAFRDADHRHGQLAAN
eukprot:5077559-Pyramimonas_sp.AAC.1